MGDSDEKIKPDVPAWQQAPPQDAQTTGSTEEPPATLEQARKFLQDPQVRIESAERKREFLRGKGISQRDIDALLEEVAQEEQADPPVTPTTVSSRWKLHVQHSHVLGFGGEAIAIVRYAREVRPLAIRVGSLEIFRPTSDCHLPRISH